MMGQGLFTVLGDIMAIEPLVTKNSITSSVENLKIRDSNASFPPVERSFSSKINALVKSGQLTQEQATQVQSANQAGMFGVLLDALQSQDENGGAASSTDPATTLMNELKNGETQEDGDSPMFDALMSLVPTAAQFNRPSSNAELNADDLLEKLRGFSAADLLFGQEDSDEPGKADSGAPSLYDSFIRLMPGKETDLTA